MLHTTLVLSVVPSFSLLNRNFPPNNPSGLSIFNYLLGLFYLTDCRHAAVSCQGSKHTGSKQSKQKYLIALISATIISYINALPLTAIVFSHIHNESCHAQHPQPDRKSVV